MFKRTKKGQAAIEYMITYGWAFLVIIAAVGVLGYFGLLNPTKYIPESCQFGEQLKCIEHNVMNNGTIEIRFRNNFGTDVVVTNANGDVSLSGAQVNIPQGEVKKITLETSRTIFEGTKERFDVIIGFKRDGGTHEHNLSGSMFAKVNDALLFT
jgi:hypothetical protein